MAGRYNSKIEINCWKEHTCGGCGSIYSYLFTRKVSGDGRSKEQATRRAQENVGKTLARDVDLYPCPACGLYQADMIGQQRAKWHKRLFWAELIILPVLLALRLNDALHANHATLWILAACALAALGHALIELMNPNNDLDANRCLAADLVSAGQIHFSSGPPAELPDVSIPPPSMLRRIAIPVLVISLVLVASAEIVRSISHWPLNDDCYPPVVGPGDHTRVYMNDSITSMKGYWRGTPHVSLISAGGIGISISATTNDNDWGSQIQAKSDETRNTSTPWVQIQMPNDSSLAGQTLQCKINLEIQYPQLEGSSSFREINTSMSRAAMIREAPAHAGERYNTIWWTGTLLGVSMILTASQLLRAAARKMQTHAKPTRILSSHQPT